MRTTTNNPNPRGDLIGELTAIMTRGHIDTRAVEAAAEMFAYAAELGARKRAHPGDDIATSLLQAEVDGERLTDMEFNFFFMLLINAGGDTTRNLVAGGICVLMDHPEERAKLEADRSLLPTAIEEMLRYVSPVIAFVRTAPRTRRALTPVAGRRRRAAGQGVHGHSQRLRRGVTLAPEMRCCRRRFLPPCPGQKVPARIAGDTHPNASLPHPHPLPECSRCRASLTCCTAPAAV